jgi:glycosyltransferase involved in cell wall biosynthesis
MNKILVLAESLRINETSSGIVSSTLIVALVELGFEVTVIYPKKFNYEVTWLDICILIPFSPEKVATGWIQKIPKIRALSTYINFGFSSQFALLVKNWKYQILLELNQQKYHSILVLGSGSEFSPHFAVSELKIDIPYFANIHDPFPFHNYPHPYRQKKSLLSWFLELRFRKVIEKATGVIFPSKFLQMHMEYIFPKLKSKSVVIPHVSISLKNLPSSESDSLVILDKTKINIIHAGSLLGPRNPKFLLNAIYNLEKSNVNILKNVNFVFIGKLAKEHQKLITLSKSVVIIDQRVSYKESLNLIEFSDAILVIEAISDFSPFMPGKLADILLKEKPIIPLCPKKSEVIRILGNSPYHAELDNQQKIKDIITRFLLDFKNNSIYNNSEELLKYMNESVNDSLKKLFG